MIIRLALLFVLYLFIAPEAEAFLVYSYDGDGNRIYYRINPEDYRINKSKKYSRIYEARGVRYKHLYSKKDRCRYWAAKNK